MRIKNNNYYAQNISYVIKCSKITNDKMSHSCSVIARCFRGCSPLLSNSFITLIRCLLVKTQLIAIAHIINCHNKMITRHIA